MNPPRINLARMKRVWLFLLAVLAIFASTTAAAMVTSGSGMDLWQIALAAEGDFLFGPMMVLLFWVFLFCAWAILSAEGARHRRATDGRHREGGCL